MRTLVRLENSNCPRCHTRMLGVLRETKGVEHVASDFATGCLVVDHQDDPEMLVSLIATADRAVAIAPNGERVMVPVDGHEATECREPPGRVPTGTSVLAASVLATSALTASALTPSVPYHAGTRGPRSASGRMASTSPPGAATCPVCHSDPGRGPRRSDRGAVRVLSRQRPAPGLVLRMVRLLVGAFRIAFRVPSPGVGGR